MDHSISRSDIETDCAAVNQQSSNHHHHGLFQSTTNLGSDQRRSALRPRDASFPSKRKDPGYESLEDSYRNDSSYFSQVEKVDSLSENLDLTRLRLQSLPEELKPPVTDSVPSGYYSNPSYQADSFLDKPSHRSYSSEQFNHKSATNRDQYRDTSLGYHSGSVPEQGTLFESGGSLWQSASSLSASKVFAQNQEGDT